MIKNEVFWEQWQAGRFDEALQCTINERPKKKGALLFKKAATDGNAVASISAGEFLYDYFMLNPEVIKGVDFARSEELSNLFNFSTFADTVDLTSATGDFAQLQGYVAEQMIAQELMAAGYDVEFPATSNQAGWDILVDGEPFQVKCGASKSIVEEHFEKYPDIPVYVNAELASYYEGNPLVLSTTVSREHVLQETTKTLEHADDLLDFEVPWIAAGVSAFSNMKRMRTEQLQFSTAVRNVVTDTASRTALAAVGQTVAGATGALLLPGAGGIVFPIVGAYVGVTQASKVSNLIKKQLAKSEYVELCKALNALIEKMVTVLNNKYVIKERKWSKLSGYLPDQVEVAFTKYHTERFKLIDNVKNELATIQRNINKNPLEAFENIISVLGKAGIHIYSLKDELTSVEIALKSYHRKL